MLNDKLKATLLVLALLLAAPIFAQQAHESDLNWLTDFETAKAKASEEDKTILMSFSGSDWCANCMRLDKTLFQSEDFASYAAENLVLLQLDFPSKRKNSLPAEQVKHNEVLAETYNPKGTFPAVVLLDDSGGKMGKLTFPAKSVPAYLEEMTGIISN